MVPKLCLEASVDCGAQFNNMHPWQSGRIAWYFCDIFDKSSKLHISMQGPDKNNLDISVKLQPLLKSYRCGKYGKRVWKFSLLHVLV